MIDAKYANILEATFLHIWGITQDKEKILWDSGIINIEQLKTNYYGFQGNLFDNYYEQTQETEIAINNNDIDFFLGNLPSRELYRAALTSYQDVMFLDIETTGLSRQYSYITLIGWVMNGNYSFYLKGQTPERFFQDLNKAKIIVTFNGSLFDLPFIKKEFPEAKIPEAHIDLRFFAKRFGYTGGQKKIEQLLKIKRPKKIKEVNGKEAIVLWYKYLAGDLKSLELLFSYNFYDIIGMQRIFDKIVDVHIINKMLPVFEKPIYRFSDQSIDFKIEATQEVYEQTKKNIKHYTLKELLSSSDRIEPLKAIGIDLTGSEEKPSGCCVLENNVAYTCMLKSDQEIIDYVLANKPMVVSIDSPLSLPHGRVKVTDDDEGRIKYGITRYCERALKKRGVNSYPCLIQSMQKLTARGIKLAEKMRSIGVPVIESFPGAAQDILRIPRKKTDLYFLKKGLIDL